MDAHTEWQRSAGALGVLWLGALLCLVLLLPSSAEASYTRHLKGYLLDKSAAVPELVIYGGSRSEKAEPGYMEHLTGIPGFNAAVMSSQPSDMLAFATSLHDRDPALRQFPLMFLSVEAFRRDNLFHPELLTMPDLMAEMPADLLTGVTLLDPVSFKPPADLAYSDGNQWRSDGSLRISRYDVALANGVSREKLLATRVKQYLASYDNFTRLSSGQKRVFETTIARMNSWHWVPVVLLPPYSDGLLSVLKRHGWTARHRETVEFLADLQLRYKMVVIDFSHVDSFGGWSEGLFDGVHGSTQLMRFMLRKVVAASNRAFDPTVPYGIPLSSRN